jgi:hypothetical protein
MIAATRFETELESFDSEPGKIAASSVTQSPVLIKLTATLLLSGSWVGGVGAFIKSSTIFHPSSSPVHPPNPDSALSIRIY